MIFDFLDTNQIRYQRVDHPPVFTCEEADRLVPVLHGAKTKNLFLRDGKGRRHFLLAVSSEKSVDLKALAITLEVSGLSLASPDRLAKYLKLTPGSVTLLGVIHDPTKEVEVIIDAELWVHDAFLCHPLINTSTLAIDRESLSKFFELTGHSPKVVLVPASDSTRKFFHQ